MPETKPESKPSEFYDAYAAFARTLRTWFVAFGIGVPALLITSDNARALLVGSGCARRVTCIFLAGVAIQVVTAFLYKSAMCYLYLTESDEAKKTGCLYKCFSWVSEWFWLEVVLDLLTLVLFSWATVEMLCLFTKTATS